MEQSEQRRSPACIRVDFNRRRLLLGWPASSGSGVTRDRPSAAGWQIYILILIIIIIVVFFFVRAHHQTVCCTRFHRAIRVIHNLAFLRASWLGAFRLGHCAPGGGGGAHDGRHHHLEMPRHLLPWSPMHHQSSCFPA